MRTMACICGTEHTFAARVWTGSCAGCGLGLLLTEDVEVLTPAAVTARVAEVAEAAREEDHERAHGARDRIFADALRAIAAGAPRAVDLARAALRADDVAFDRHCA